MRVTRRQLASIIRESIDNSERQERVAQLEIFIKQANDYSFLNMADTMLHPDASPMLTQQDFDYLDALIVDRKLELTNDPVQIVNIVFESMTEEEEKNNLWIPDGIGTDLFGRVMFRYSGGFLDTKAYHAYTDSIFNDFNQKYGKNILHVIGAQTSNAPGSKLMIGKTAEMYMMGKKYLSENLNVSEYDWFGFYVHVDKEKIKTGLNSDPAFELTYYPYKSKAMITVGQQSKLRTYSRAFDPYTDENVYVYMENDNTKSGNNWKIFSKLDDAGNFYDEGITGVINGLEIFSFLEKAFPASGNLFKLLNNYED